MKRITILFCSFFVFASFTSERKTGEFDIVGRWVDLEGTKGFKEFVFYEGYYIKLVSTIQSMNRENERLQYNINWEHDPYILSIFPESKKGMATECFPSGNKTFFGLKIIDDNHIQIAWDKGIISRSTFKQSKTFTLTRQ